MRVNFNTVCTSLNLGRFGTWFIYIEALGCRRPLCTEAHFISNYFGITLTVNLWTQVSFQNCQAQILVNRLIHFGGTIWRIELHEFRDLESSGVKESDSF